MRKALFILLITTSAFAGSRRCGFSIDTSTSVDPTARRAALSRIAEGLPDLVTDLHCTTISVASFTDQGWFTPVAYYDLPPDEHAPCHTNATTAQRVLAPFASYQAAAREQCAAQRALEDQRNTVARALALRRVTHALEAVRTTRSRCTDITTHLALLAHLRRSDDVDFVLTDAQQTCIVNGVVPLARMTFILLPGGGRAPDVTHRFPGTTGLVPADLSAPRWWVAP